MAKPFLLLGQTESGKPLGITGTEFAQHKHILGISGSGKSSFLAWIALSLLKQAVGFSLLDPHGDLATLCLRYLLEGDFFQNPSFARRLWYVQFNRPDKVLSFNILKQPYPPHTIAANVLETFHRAIPATVATTNIDNILLAAVVVLSSAGKSLADLPSLLFDSTYRNQLLGYNGLDPLIVQFFQSKFTEKGSLSFVDSTLKRAFLLTFSPPLRNSLGQAENKLDFKELIDTGISVIFNLSGLDDSTQRFFGCLLTIGFEQAFLSRASLSPEKRRPYHLIIDEFPLFASKSGTAFAHMLEQVRKFHGTLYLSNQTMSQISPEIAGSLQNTFRLLMRMGFEDSSWAAQHMFRRTREEPSILDILLGRENSSNPFNQLHSMQEAKQFFETLERQQAIVRIGNTPHLITTPTLPKPTASEADIRNIEDTYAQLLLTPVGKESRGMQSIGLRGGEKSEAAGQTEQKESAPPQSGKRRAHRRIP